MKMLRKREKRQGMNKEKERWRKEEGRRESSRHNLRDMLNC